MASETFFDRLQQAAKHAGVAFSQAAIGNRVNADRRTVDRWFRGGLPAAEKIFEVADNLGVSARWLATGEGPMNGAEVRGAMTPQEEELLARYRDSDPRWQLSLRLLSLLATEEQLEAAPDVNMVLARLFGKRPAEMRYSSDKDVRQKIGDAPHVKARKTHQS